MVSHLSAAVCLVTLACFLYSANSEHVRKKIIVKVPHVIKHIHHQRFKPIHVHKVHAKKVEHHHHASHEEKLWPKYKGHRGSFSSLKPVLEEPVDFLDTSGIGIEQDNSRGGRGYDGEEFIHEKSHQNQRSNNAQRHRKPKYIRDDEHEWLSKGGFGEEVYSKDEMFGSEHREMKSRGRVQKQQRRKQRVKQSSRNLDESDWKPLMNIDSWESDDDVKPNYRGRHYGPIIMSEEDEEDDSSREESDYHEENIQKKKRKYKKNSSSKPKWNKEISVYNDNEETQKIVVPSQPYQAQTPSPLVAQIPIQFMPMQVVPQQGHMLQQQPIIQHSLHQQQPLVQQAPQQQQQPLIQQPIQQQALPHIEHFKQTKEQHAPHVQHMSWPATSQAHQSSWPVQSKPVTQNHWQSGSSSTLTTQSPKVSVWTGHHLELPKQSMWQVQQHSVPASSVPVNPVQMISAIEDHTPAPRHQFSQLAQSSHTVHNVVTPSWPLNHGSQTHHQGSPAKQVWQQSVQNGGSAYTMEVLSFPTQNNKHKK